jgi:glutathione S-transferase
MIKLYHFEMSPFCTKVELMMNAKRIPYEIEYVSCAQHGSVKTYSVTGKLPAIDHDGKIINDSTEIAYYLDEKFPDTPLVPTEDQLWAKCHFYEDWSDESLNFYMMKLRWLPQNREHWAKELVKRDRGLIRWFMTRFAAKMVLKTLDKQGTGRKSEAAALKDIDRHLRALSIDLQGNDFLVGKRLSVADISIYSQLLWVRKIPEGDAAVRIYPNILSWMKRLDSATQKTT